MVKNDYRKEIIFGVILFASFFLPYIKLGTLSLSGFQIADNAKNIFDLGNLFNAQISDDAKILIYKAYSLYLIPVFAGLVVIFALLDVNPKLIAAVAGLYVIFAFIYCVDKFEKFVDLVGIGAYLSLLSGALLLIFALMSEDKKVNSISDEKIVNNYADFSISKETGGNSKKTHLQEWQLQNPTKSINDYFSEFGH